MATKLVLAPEVKQDVCDAYAWYESKRVGLGDEFLDSIRGCLAAVAAMPHAWARVLGEYRRALVRRFPYEVFYKHSADTVTVYAVFHTSRDPDRWRQRLGHKKWRQ